MCTCQTSKFLDVICRDLVYAHPFAVIGQLIQQG